MSHNQHGDAAFMVTVWLATTISCLIVLYPSDKDNKYTLLTNATHKKKIKNAKNATIANPPGNTQELLDVTRELLAAMDRDAKGGSTAGGQDGGSGGGAMPDDGKDKVRWHLEINLEINFKNNLENNLEKNLENNLENNLEINLVSMVHELSSLKKRALVCDLVSHCAGHQSLLPGLFEACSSV